MNDFSRYYRNSDPANIEGFGLEWAAFDQSELRGAEYQYLFDRYFELFPFAELPAGAEGFDIGCGSGRWAQGVAPLVGKLHCIEASEKALAVARRRLEGFDNIDFHLASIEHLPLADESQDFGYSLGVLHHVPDPQQGLSECVRKLKPGAPFLLFVYYNLECRSWWYRGLFELTEILRKVTWRLPFRLRKSLCEVIAATIYWPLARLARFLHSQGFDVSNIPLSFYRDCSFYTMRTDALDRFGTAFVNRYSRNEVETMMRSSDLIDIRFLNGTPQWLAIGRRAEQPNAARSSCSKAASRLRVTHVIGDLAPGGAEAILYRLVQYPAQIDHHVICLQGRNWYSDLLVQAGVEVEHLGMRSPLSALVRFPRLVGAIKTSQPDVVQTWMYNSNLIGGLASRLCTTPCVWGIHHSIVAVLPFARRLVARAGGVLARWAPDYVINCSSRSAELHSALGYSAADGEVIRNGYDPLTFFPDDDAKKATRRSLGVHENAFLIGSIARWSSYKDIPSLLTALTLASRSIENLRCLLIGDDLDTTNAELTNAINAVGCAPNVLLLGRRRDIADLARSMDLHVLASLTEAFPNVVAETMLSGTPNVVTDVGDSAFMIGDSGWAVEPKNPQHLANAIIKAHLEWETNPTKWEKRRAASRQRIAENFTFDRMAGAYERVWLTVAKQPKKESHR